MSDGWKWGYDERLPEWLNDVLPLCAYLGCFAAIAGIVELFNGGIQNIGVIGWMGLVGAALGIIVTQGWAEKLFRSVGHGWLVIGILALGWALIDACSWPMWPIGTFFVFALLAILEVSYWMYDHTFPFWLVGPLLAAALLSSGLYSLRLYNQIESDFRESENRIVSPTVDEESVPEIGYIYDLKRDIDFRKMESDYGVREITWYIKVPSTGKFYTCHWASGYSRFSKDEGVEVIHRKEKPGIETDTSFLVGLNGEQRGHSAGCFW